MRDDVSKLQEGGKGCEQVSNLTTTQGRWILNPGGQKKKKTMKDRPVEQKKPKK